ncbi:hypothetical protein GOD93_28170 [Sinorhizobium medicae]|nr:hypothetical protein [Sinorhizobium medicae]
MTGTSLRSTRTKGIAPIDPLANAYNRLTVMINQGGKWVEAETYIASPQQGTHLPNTAYLKHLRDGATHHGLPETYRAFLASLPDDSSK